MTQSKARLVGAAFGCALAAVMVDAAERPAGSDRWSVRTAESLLRELPQPPLRWSYEVGVVLSAYEQLYRATGERRYLDFVKGQVDALVQPDGSIRGYRVEEYNLDQINAGKVLFLLISESHDEKEKERYRAAAALLRSQLATHPRVSEGGFWHKKVYPNQMWLDGLYMEAPFYAQYGRVFGEPDAFDDVARQFLIMEKHARDPKTGLLYHGWDESRQQKWASPETGLSPHFWSRAMGWYAMALVDALDHVPQDHPRRADVVAVLQRLARAVAGVQSRTKGIWYQVLDAEGREGNYAESSGSAMFVYALAKGIRNGWLSGEEYRPVVDKAWRGLVDGFVRVTDEGRVLFEGTCRVAGLGGNPYRDGSYEYYTRQTSVVTNDPKGIGPFIMAAIEVEALQGPKEGNAQP